MAIRGGPLVLAYCDAIMGAGGNPNPDDPPPAAYAVAPTVFDDIRRELGVEPAAGYRQWIGGFRIIVDPEVPRDEVHLVAMVQDAESGVWKKRTLKVVNVKLPESVESETAAK